MESIRNLNQLTKNKLIYTKIKLNEIHFIKISNEKQKLNQNTMKLIIILNKTKIKLKQSYSFKFKNKTPFDTLIIHIPTIFCYQRWHKFYGTGKWLYGPS